MIDLNHASNAIGAQERPLGGRVRAGSLRRRAAAAGGVKIVGRGRTRGSEIEEDELSGDRAHVAGRQDDCCDRKLDDRIFRNGAVADRNVGAVGRLRAGDIACGRNEGPARAPVSGSRAACAEAAVTSTLAVAGGLFERRKRGRSLPPLAHEGSPIVEVTHRRGSPIR